MNMNIFYINYYHFMIFPAAFLGHGQSGHLRELQQAADVISSAFSMGSRGFSQGFSHEKNIFSQPFMKGAGFCLGKSWELLKSWENLIRFLMIFWFSREVLVAGFCWTFGTVGTWIVGWFFFRPRTRLFWAWSRRCLLVQLVHSFLLKDVEPPLMLQLQHIQRKLYCCWYHHFFLASSFHEHLGSICQQPW